MMGLSNKIVTSEKDLHAMLKCGFFKELEGEGESVVSVSAVLKIKLPSAGADYKEEDEGCTTPKAVDLEKNVVTLKCPPPPRKPKSVPSKKRKAQKILLDLSHEIESLFPSNIVGDFVCGKIKKIRKE